MEKSIVPSQQPSVSSLSRQTTSHRPVLPERHRALAKVYFTRQIVAECLQTLDIFSEIMEEDNQARKIVRDVKNNIKLEVLDAGDYVYQRGSVAESFYLVMKGAVSLCYPVVKQPEEGEEEPSQVELIDNEVDTRSAGYGFGESQFVQNKKRSLSAKVKSDNTLIGSISGSCFESIIQSYRQRIYYHKVEMFSTCPMLRGLQRFQLQFIVNASKTNVFGIKKKVIQSGEMADKLCLIAEGEVELVKEQAFPNINRHMYSNNKKGGGSPRQSGQLLVRQIKLGIKQAGEFMGDGQLALNKPYITSAICKTEKVKCYEVDERIIMSQMTPQTLAEIRAYYQLKNNYHENKVDKFNSAKAHVQRTIEESEAVDLSPEQLQVKRRINNRYVEKRPSLIGKMSPREISKSLQRKLDRIQTEPRQSRDSSEEKEQEPVINMLHEPKKIKAKTPTNNPKRHKMEDILERHHSMQSEHEEIVRNYGASVPYQAIRSQEREAESPPLPPMAFKERSQQIPQTIDHRPMLVYLRPFKKKVESLHERLAKEYREMKRNKAVSIPTLPNKEKELTRIEKRRIDQFITKIKMSKQRQIHRKNINKEVVI